LRHALNVGIDAFANNQDCFSHGGAPSKITTTDQLVGQSKSTPVSVSFGVMVPCWHTVMVNRALGDVCVRPAPNGSMIALSGSKGSMVMLLGTEGSISITTLILAMAAPHGKARNTGRIVTVPSPCDKESAAFHRLFIGFSRRGNAPCRCAQCAATADRSGHVTEMISWKQGRLLRVRQREVIAKLRLPPDRADYSNPQ
jgi:hypothetical protein